MPVVVVVVWRNRHHHDRSLLGILISTGLSEPCVNFWAVQKYCIIDVVGNDL